MSYKLLLDVVIKQLHVYHSKGANLSFVAWFTNTHCWPQTCAGSLNAAFPEVQYCMSQLGRVSAWYLFTSDFSVTERSAKFKNKTNHVLIGAVSTKEQGD